MSPELSTMFDSEATLHIGENPIPLDIRITGHGFNARKQQRNHGTRPFLERLPVEFKNP